MVESGRRVDRTAVLRALSEVAFALSKGDWTPDGRYTRMLDFLDRPCNGGIMLERYQHFFLRSEPSGDIDMNALQSHVAAATNGYVDKPGARFLSSRVPTDMVPS